MAKNARLQTQHKLVFNAKYSPEYLNYCHLDRLRPFIAHEYRISISKIKDHVDQHLISMTVWTGGKASVSVEVYDHLCVCVCSAVTLSDVKSLYCITDKLKHVQDKKEEELKHKLVFKTAILAGNLNLSLLLKKKKTKKLVWNTFCFIF